MPANVTPEYERAEQRFREAVSDPERLAALQDMLGAIPKHKGTEKMQADIKRRLSQLRKAQAKSGLSKGPDPFHIPRSGAGQVVFIGAPNTGKSSLLAATTNAEVKTADYPFTTTVPHPGIWTRDDIPIELVDTPPFTPEHIPPGLMGTIRAADVVCPVADGTGDALEQTDMVLSVLGQRGLTLRSLPRQQLAGREPGLRPALLILNKVDAAPAGVAEALRELYLGQLEVVAVSARTGAGLEGLFRRLWELLAVIRVYPKQPGQPADLKQPFTLPLGSTVEDLARRIHRELPERMKYARVWGGGRFDGQQVHRTEVLKDKEIVEIHE